MKNTKHSIIERELRSRLVDGRLPRGVTFEVAEVCGTSVRQVHDVMVMSLIRSTGNRAKPEYVPHGALVERGDCLELEKGPASRYDIISRFNRYRRFHKISVEGKNSFDREFKQYLKKTRMESDWKWANK